METNDQTDDRVERTLAAFDGMAPAQAPPFLFTRIQARLNDPADGWPRIIKPAFAALALLTVVQVYLMLGGTGAANPAASSDPIDQLMKEYRFENHALNY